MAIFRSMPVYKADPRTYVQQIPLPVSSQKGLKIQARNIDVYNPTVPARNEVRVSNYIRRMQQMSQQGFKSVSYKPYQGIGDPFYLDEKKLILHALGQWNEVSIEISFIQFWGFNLNENPIICFCENP